jgi:citrate lyase synthetase
MNLLPLTRAYNQRMHDILGDPHGAARKSGG